VAWLWGEHVGSRVRGVAPAVTTSSLAAEVLTRHNQSTALHFVLNHGAQPALCELQRAARDLFDERAVPPNFELPGYGYRILRESL